MKYRVFSDSNYIAFQDDDYNIFRYQIWDDKPITKLQYPEIVDISLGTFCIGGCLYCYASANTKGVLYKNVVNKINDWLSSLTVNQKPFQIAIGGGGEPTFHSELPELLKLIKHHDVVPSYTTAGLYMTAKLMEATKKYCGGVAVTAHPHIDTWKSTVRNFLVNGIRTNIHCIVGKENNGTEFAENIRSQFPDVDKVVLLPFVPMGYGELYPEINERELISGLVLSQKPGYAIGAMYQQYMLKWPYLFEKHSTFNELDFSGYIELTDPPVMYKSSFIRETR
jgi:MoaA/NifB/PqqE/SkfB family radical SAM enzyme